MGDKLKEYYSSVCRTCLQSSNVEMYNLNALINDNFLDGGEKISYMNCLQYCLTVLDEEGVVGGGDVMPTKICIDCASALEVAYWFMKNASKAQELLRIRINEMQAKQRELERQAAAETAAAEEQRKPKRYRCKICNTKLETKRSLKDHVKLHLDIIAYNCQLCSFEHHQRNYLIEHYQLQHDIEATPEQLKPKTKTIPAAKRLTTTTTSSTISATRQDSNLVKEQQHPQQQPYEVYVQPSTSQNSHDIIYTTCQQQQNQNFIYTSASGLNTSVEATPLEGNTTTTTLFNQPNAETFTFNAFDNNLNNTQNELAVGNEFIVMGDGSVDNVMGKGVVIEYINAGDNDAIALENGLVLDKILQVQNADSTNILLPQQSEILQMDVDDLIIEDPENTPEQTQDVPTETPTDVPSPVDEDMIPASFIEQPPKRNNCKICAKEFDSQDELKTHMLTHNEIPHFFCDHCTFYTFFKIDLHQHYKSKHNVQPSNKQLQPRNKQRYNNSEADMDPVTKNAVVQKIERYARSQKLVYCCDICFYECDLKYDIRRHYLIKHRMHVQDIQQVQSRANKSIQPISNAAKKQKTATITPIDDPTPDYPNGLNCRKCKEVFYWRNKLYEHYKLHDAEEEALKRQKQALKVSTTSAQSMLNDIPQQILNVEEQPQLQQTQTQMQLQLPPQQQQEIQLHLPQQKAEEIELQLQQPQPQVQSTEIQLQLQQPQQQQTEMQIQQSEMQLNLPQQQQQIILQQLPQPHQEVVITTTPIDSTLQTFNDVNVDSMSLGLTQNNTINNPTPLTPSSSSTYTLPSDAIPQIVEMEQTIETDMDFDFNGDALFEDFDDVDVENETEDNELRNVVLTSDDDFDDMLKEQGETQTQTPPSYCAQCQKSFLSQYQFENHMFLHRGLAPYRCEMCTNLYNTKRALIRHYTAVHKKVPSRDMIQAKGDKVYVYDNSSMDITNIEESKAVTLMCAKCTYESTDFPSVQLHLNTNHSIHEDSYILKKLPYECPRCIRSFSTKAKLARHLERNHSAKPINHSPVQINSSDTTTTSITTTTAPSLNNNNVNMMQSNATSEQGGFRDEHGGQQQYSGITHNECSGNYNNDIPIDECIAPSFLTESQCGDFNLENITSSCTNAADTIPTTENNADLSPSTSASTTKTEPDSSYSSDPQSAQETTDVVLYKCSACQFPCTTSELIRQHTKSQQCRELIKLSTKDNPLFKCEICERKYATVYLLRFHLKRHLARPFCCSCCPKTYVTKIELEEHQKMHSDERPYKCEKCPNSFRYAHHLKRHQDIIHFGKRFVCPEANCNRQFTTTDQLKIHKWSHCGIVPYKCKYCDGLFKKRVLLRKHCWKVHKKYLTEEELAKNFRNSLGYTMAAPFEGDC